MLKAENNHLETALLNDNLGMRQAGTDQEYKHREDHSNAIITPEIRAMNNGQTRLVSGVGKKVTSPEIVPQHRGYQAEWKLLYSLLWHISQGII